MPDTRLACFLTFGSYGSRLHGDPRGSVDRHSNASDVPHLPRDDYRRNFERRLMVSGGFEFDRTARVVLQRAFGETCEIRRWSLLALNIRMSHVHAVVSGDTDPNSIMQVLKANGTRELRAANVVLPDQKVWARHGSTIHLWEPGNVELAIDYTMNRQGVDLPGSDPRLWRPDPNA